MPGRLIAADIVKTAISLPPLSLLAAGDKALVINLARFGFGKLQAPAISDAIGQRVNVETSILQRAIDGARRINHLTVTIRGEQPQQLAELISDRGKLTASSPAPLFMAAYLAAPIVRIFSDARQ